MITYDLGRLTSCQDIIYDYLCLRENNLMSGYHLRLPMSGENNIMSEGD
jgi:hypothetical protein